MWYMITDLFQAAQEVLPFFELLNADDDLVSCSFGDFLLEKRVLCQTLLWKQIPVSSDKDM